MSDPMRVLVEVGWKNKKAAAWAEDWPGLERGGKTPEDAVAKLEAYRERYLRVAKRCRLGTAFQSQHKLEVVDTYEGTGSTDFWGISFAPSDFDRELPDDKEWERRLRLLQACWAEFDEIAARVSPTLKKGPRGGGRDRDEIIRHTLAVECEDFAPGVGVKVPREVVFTPDGLATYREQFIDALRSQHREGIVAVGKKSTLNFLLRHAAYHVMDHAWEMQDKDLTDQDS